VGLNSLFLGEIILSEEGTIESKIACTQGGNHEFDLLDYDGSNYTEYGHCIKCGHWIDTDDGTDETEIFQESEKRLAEA
jgi:hypothetical protein